MKQYALALAACWFCATPAQAQSPGTVTGQIMYPSDYIPEDLAVCADNLRGGKATCTKEHRKGKGGKTTYRLSLPPGDYQIYAKLTDPGSFSDAYGEDYRAYYSEFVTCGLMATCTSHRPITVTIRSGRTTEGIDPADWYDF